MVATCTYCGAPDNGTCAYPSEGKPGCVRDASLANVEPVTRMAMLFRGGRWISEQEIERRQQKSADEQRRQEVERAAKERI